MILGHKQKAIIELGKKKDFITSDDARRFWSKPLEMRERMNTLVILGYFKKPKDKGNKMVWDFNDK